MTNYEDLPRNPETGAVEAERVEFPIRYSLLSPIDSMSGPLGAVELREPTVLDLEAVYREKTEMGRAIALLSNLLELSPGEVRRFGARDYARLSETVAAFF